MTEAYTSDVTIPDLFEPNGNGLFDNVVWLDAQNDHWKGGIQYEANCTDSLVTISSCYPDGIAISGIAEKSATWDKVFRGSKAFTIFQEYDCSPAGMGLTLSNIDNATALAIKALSETASREAERVLWSGQTNNSPAINYPNFVQCDVCPKFDSTGRILLQPTPIMVTGATLDLVEGLGRLEESASNCYNGRLFIHVPLVLAASLYNQNLITRVNNRWLTANGNRVILGNGYPSTIGPGGATNIVGVTQMYATSPIFGLRSSPRVFGPVESLDRNVNTFKFIAEQTFLFGWTCCLVGVSVTIGGIEAGTFNNDTAAT